MYKIAMVVPSLVTGGAENMAAQLATRLDKSKFCLELLVISSLKGTAIEKTVREEGIITVFFGKSLGFSLKTLFRVFKHLNQLKPNIIHTHLSGCVYVIPWAILNRVKIIHTIHNRPIYEARGIIRMMLKILYKTKLAIPVAISDTIAKEAIDLYRIKPKEVETVYNPVDTLIFKEKCGKNIKTNDEIVFINVARFSPQKNQEGLVEAFCEVYNQLPFTRLILIGDGELKPGVQEKVKQLKLEDKIDFTGNVSDIPQRIARADVFVLPSFYEGLPMTILEAMAVGLPVIATKVGGVPDIVKENGILIQKGDKAGLVDAMLLLAKDKELRKKMSEIAQNEVKKYDLSKASAQYEELYERYGKK